MIIAQIFLVFLVLLIMGLVVLGYRQRRISTRNFFFWTVLWTAAATAIIFPNSTMVVARFLGIGRGTDLVVYLSVILILYLLFKVYMRLEQMDREVTKIVRAIALREGSLGNLEDGRDKVSQPLDRRPSG
jgi:hypothetical protein